MGGHSFQFAPGRGVVEHEGVFAGGEEIIPANPDMFRAREPKPAPAPARVAPAAPRVEDKPFNVVKAAKGRRRELRLEIARLRRLESELAELNRLIAAAENKPRTVVREIAVKRLKV